MTVFDNFRTILDLNEHVLQVGARNFGVDVALGKYPNISFIRKFGKASVGTSFVTILEPATLYPYVSSATTMTISSDNANDTVAGTGGRTVEFFGHDADFNVVSDIVDMDGQTPVTLTPDLLRIWRARVRTAGSTETNEGVIYIGDGTVTAGVPANIRAQIGPDIAQTQMCLWTIPAGKTGLLVSKLFSVGRAKDMEVRIVTRKQNEVFLVREEVDLFESTFQVQHTLPIVLEEKSDVEMRMKTSTGSADVHGEFEIYIMDN